MAPKNRAEYREAIAKAFLDCLNEKGLEWKKGWDAVSMAPQNAVTKAPYHGVNQFYLGLLAMVNGYTDPRWATMTQIMDKDGKYHPGEKWHLQKGSKAVYVEYWYAWNPTEKKALTWREYGKLPAEEQALYVPKARYTPVFHASMIDGIAPLQAVEREPRKLVDIVVQMTTSMGVGMEFDGGDSAFYRPSEDKIHMPTADKFFSDYEFNATVLHELAHATGHESRLNRPKGSGFGSPEYAYEELVAEISSCFMGVTLDMEQTPQHLENHKAYVQSWIQAITDKPETLMAAIRDAQKAADYMDYHAGLVNEQVHQAVQESSAVISAPSEAPPEQTATEQAPQQMGAIRDAQKKELAEGLPELCFSVLPGSGALICLKRGESGYYPSDWSTDNAEQNRELADYNNQRLGVTPAQRMAMETGSMHGWDVSGADPQVYLEEARYIRSSPIGTNAHIADPNISLLSPIRGFLYRYEVAGKESFYLDVSTMPDSLMGKRSRCIVLPEMVRGNPLIPVTVNRSENGALTMGLAARCFSHDKEKNAGYEIIAKVRVGSVEYVLGEHDKELNLFVTWERTPANDGDGPPNYYWGRYFDSRDKAIQNLCDRASDKHKTLSVFRKLGAHPKNYEQVWSMKARLRAGQERRQSQDTKLKKELGDIVR